MSVVNKGNYFATRYEAWSYATCIRATTADGIMVVNRTHYSKTTTRHQTEDAAFWRGKPHVIVTDAPLEATQYALFEAAQTALETYRMVAGIGSAERV